MRAMYSASAGRPRAAGLLIGGANRGDQLGGGRLRALAVPGRRRPGIAAPCADRRDLRDVRQRLQLVFQEPVLQRPMGEIVSSGAIDEHIRRSSPRPSRRDQGRLRRGRKAPLHLVEVLEHPGTRPVLVGAILEDHVDELVAEERITAHRLRTRDRQHRRRQRKRNLVLDDLRRLARERRADDHLRIRQVRNRVERRRSHGPHARRCDKCRCQQHENRFATDQRMSAAITWCRLRQARSTSAADRPAA